MNLCTLAQVRGYIGKPVSDTNLDAQISALIPPASAMVSRFCQRTFSRNVHSNVRFNGRGQRALMLPDYPIISVQALKLLSDTIAASPDGIQSGYMADDKTVYLIGCYLGWSVFPRLPQSILVSWTAGFTTTEADTIPSGTPYTVTPSQGAGFVGGGQPFDTTGWALTDQGVTFTGGAALAKVSGVPTAGQYAFAAGVYTFAAADAGKAVTIAYDFVPWDVTQGVIELVYLKIQQRSNLGVRSRTLAGESVAYETNDMTPAVRAMLQPWRRMVPIGP